MLAVALAVGIAAIAVFAYTLSTSSVQPNAAGRPDASASVQPAQSSAQSPVPAPSPVAESTVPPANARFGPHKQNEFPPLPFGPSPPARSPDVVRVVYKFAGEHPEVLGYVPCYCGCERSGHRGNDDCFVTARAANGDVTAWEPHGMT
jgi:hypothetical protein